MKTKKAQKGNGKSSKGYSKGSKKVSAKVLSERALKAWATRRAAKGGKTAGRRAAMKAWASRRAAAKRSGRAK